MQTKTSSEQLTTPVHVGSGDLLGITDNQRENGQHPECHENLQTPHEKPTNEERVRDYAWALQHGFQHVPQLLETMNDSCFGEEERRIAAKTPRVGSCLSELEALWKSLGRPSTELWQRLYFYDKCNFVCSNSYKREVKPNEKS